MALLLLVAPTVPAGAVAPLHTVKWRFVANTGPVPRQSAGMVYDPAAHEFVLFGGYSIMGLLNDTWAFANGTWTELTNLSTSPSPRWYFSMAYDPALRAVILFGGRNSFQDFSDTWEFNGSAWTNLSLTASPPAQTSGRMAYDAADGYLVMYGGYSIMIGAPSYYDSTWIFNHGAWTNLTTKVTGAPPDPHAVTYAAYDSANREVLLYGGSGTTSASG